VYPSKALQAGIEGSVVANAYVSRDGSVSDVKILAADPPGWFEQDVVRMLKQWRFAPERTEFIVQVPFNFEFEN
jgi:protein TonB